MFEFMKKTLTKQYKGRLIKLENHWFNGFKIFVDEVLIHHDYRMVWIDKDKPFFEFKLKTSYGLESAAVFVNVGIADVDILFQVNGQTVARTDIPPRDVIA